MLHSCKVFYMRTNTDTQTITFDRAYAESRFFASNIDAIKAQVSRPGYVWNALGKAVAEKSIRQAMQAQMVPCTAANVTAALAFVGEGK